MVFILDGFDEYASGANEDNFIYKLIAKCNFPESIVIVSSRPAATQPFRMVTEKWIEVVGKRASSNDLPASIYSNDSFKTDF